VKASRIAARVQSIKPSPSTAAADRAAALKQAGQKIINLVVGEPDFDTPAPIRQAAFDAMQRGETRYTMNAGTVALRQAISEKLQRENGLHYPIGQIIVTCGAKHAIFNALSCTLNVGDEVLIPAPFWVSYPDMVLANEGVPVILPCVEENDFKLQADVLRKAITPRTRWLLLNSPTNPTGATYSAQDLQALADVLLDHPNVMIMSDDIYEHIAFVDGPISHLGTVAPALLDRILVVNGVSKTYAMTGWRIGYAAGPADIITAMGVLQSQSTSNASSVGQAAALAALTGDQSFISEWAAIYRARRDKAVALINAVPGLSCRTPGGAFYLFVNCGGLIGKRTPQGKTLATDSDVVMFFLENAGVALVAGSAYGVPGFFRMSTATSIDIIEQGIQALQEVIATLQ